MLDEGTTTRNALQIADEVAQLGASLSTASSMDATTVSGRSLAKNFARDADPDGRRRPAAGDSRGGDRAAARRAGSASWCSSARTRRRWRRRSRRRRSSAIEHPYGFSEIGTEASVKAHDARRHAGVLEAELRAEQRRARRCRRHLDGRAAGAGRKGVRRLGARNACAAFAWIAPTTTKAKLVIVDKPGSAQTQLRVADDWRAALVARLPPDAVDEHGARRPLLQPHQHEPAGRMATRYGASSQFIFRRSARPVPGGERGADRRDGASCGGDVQGDSRDGREADDRGGAAQREEVDGQLAAWGVRDDAATPSAISRTCSSTIWGWTTTRSTRARCMPVTAEQALAMAKKYLGADRLVVMAVGDRSRRSNRRCGS